MPWDRRVHSIARLQGSRENAAFSRSGKPRAPDTMRIAPCLEFIDRLLHVLRDLSKSSNGFCSIMRVLHVINGLETGGAETVLYRLTTYRSDVQHEVISLEDRGTFSDRLENDGVVVNHLNWKSPLSSISGFIRLYRLLRRSRAEVVQAWMYRANLLAGIAGKLAGIPVVWNIRSSTLDPLRLQTRILARLAGRLRIVPVCIGNQLLLPFR